MRVYAQEMHMYFYYLVIRVSWIFGFFGLHKGQDHGRAVWILSLVAVRSSVRDTRYWLRRSSWSPRRPVPSLEMVSRTQFVFRRATTFLFIYTSNTQGTIKY